jgi:hypothetical protein
MLDTRPYYDVLVGQLLDEGVYVPVGDHGRCTGAISLSGVGKGTKVFLNDDASGVLIATLHFGAGELSKGDRGEPVCSFGASEDHVKITARNVRIVGSNLSSRRRSSRDRCGRCICGPAPKVWRRG